MKTPGLFCCALVGCAALASAQSPDIPHLRKQGTATQLIVDGRPFLLLAGELGNNTATSLDYMKLVWPKLVENYTLEVSFSTPPGVPGGPPPQEPFPNSAAIFIAAGPDEFYAAGSGVTVTFTPNTPGPPFAGLATVEEGTFVNGRWVPGRRLAGDDAGQGETLVLPRLYVPPSPLGWTGGLAGPSTQGIQRVTLYRYR